MPKAYWVSNYHEVRDAKKLAEYASLAGPAIEAGGGKFLARGVAAAAYESGVLARTVIIEFASVADAVATHDSDGYQKALQALAGGAIRDLRIVEGV